MIVQLQTVQHLEFLSLKGGGKGSSESTLVKIPHYWNIIFLDQTWFFMHLCSTGPKPREKPNVSTSPEGPCPEVIKLFSCSTQLSTKFPLLIKTKIPNNKEVSCFQSSDDAFIMLINVKMSTIVGI